MNRALALVVLAACESPPTDTRDAAPEIDASPSGEWPFALPAQFPTPRLPPDTKLTVELAELGRHLFYDKRLSGNGTQACASCHEQARAFTDGRVLPVGSTGTMLERNAMSLTNIVYNPTFTWANHILTTLEKQALVPMFGTEPVELGLTGNEEIVLERLRSDPMYQSLYAAAYREKSGPIEMGDVVAALSAFERRLVSGNAPIDRHQRGEATLSDSALRGEALFFSERLECHHCHGGFNYTVAVDERNLDEPAVAFFNTGLYNIGGDGSFPVADQGLYDLTLVPSDRGRFRPPSLRNIAVTAPYMHEGSFATLDDVISFYERGGREIMTGPNAGDGKLSPYKSLFVVGFTLTADERADLKAFLESLTDEDFLTDPSIADPFEP